MDEEQTEKIAGALELIAVHLKYLGNGNASTEMGAIEGVAVQSREGSERIADGLHAIAEAISNHSEI